MKHHRRKYWVGRFADIDDANRAAIAKRDELFTNNLSDHMRHQVHG